MKAVLRLHCKQLQGNCSGIAVESLQCTLNCSEKWHVVRHCNQQKLVVANFTVIQMQNLLQ